MTLDEAHALFVDTLASVGLTVEPVASKETEVFRLSPKPAR